MKSLTTEFQFEIGDMVYHRASQHNARKVPIKMIIIERLAQQCPGGVQHHYTVRCNDGIVKFNEVELSREMPPLDETATKMLENELRAITDKVNPDEKRVLNLAVKILSSVELKTEKPKFKWKTEKTTSKEHAMCPYCCAIQDHDEDTIDFWDHEIEFQCEKCGKTFNVKTFVDRRWESYPIEDE